MNASAVVRTVSWILSITSLLIKTNKKVFSYSSSVHISSSSLNPNNLFQITASHICLYFMENLWVWSSSIFTRNSQRLIDPKMPKHERFVESILYNLRWAGGGRVRNKTTETQHDFCSLLEKRGCLFLLPVKLHGGSEKQRPCWVTEESEETEETCQPFSACPWREKLPICKCGCAEQKGRASIWYGEQQATDSGKLNKHQILVLLHCLSLLVITGITLEKKADLQFSWSMCKTVNSGAFPRQWEHMGRKNQ